MLLHKETHDSQIMWWSVQDKHVFKFKHLLLGCEMAQYPPKKKSLCYHSQEQYDGTLIHHKLSNIGI